MKTIGIVQLGQKVFDCYEFDGVWKKHIGVPEKNFSCFIQGGSGNGKTDYCVKFAKYLSEFAKVLYVSHEEGISKSIQEAFARNNMHEVSGKVVLAEKATVAELIVYLKRKNSPKIMIIDSLDYMNLTKADYIKIRESCPKKAVIIISWSEGKEPATTAGKKIKYMCDIKINVSNFRAYPASRYGGHDPYIIWDKSKKLSPPDEAVTVQPNAEQGKLFDTPITEPTTEVTQ
ncbi:MAG TPA: hypothetical protein PK431_01530 [Chitinophagales bacterium]|nr:hypothetical protein [Chitinophagales bacterium]